MTKREEESSPVPRRSIRHSSVRPSLIVRPPVHQTLIGLSVPHRYFRPSIRHSSVRPSLFSTSISHWYVCLSSVHSSVHPSLISTSMPHQSVHSSSVGPSLISPTVSHRSVRPSVLHRYVRPSSARPSAFPVNTVSFIAPLRGIIFSTLKQIEANESKGKQRRIDYEA